MMGVSKRMKGRSLLSLHIVNSSTAWLQVHTNMVIVSFEPSPAWPDPWEVEPSSTTWEMFRVKLTTNDRTWVHTFDISSCPPTSHPPYATGNITSTSNFLTKSSRPTRTPAAFRQDNKFISSLIRLTMNRRRDGIAWGSNGGGGFDGSRAGKTSS